MNALFRVAVIGLIITIIWGCDQASIRTESMIRRDMANAEAARLVTKAQALATHDVLHQPSQHLDDLIMIQDLLAAARKTYTDAKILKWHNSELAALQSKLTSLNEPLARRSLDAFEMALVKSKKFKQKKSDVETLPVYDNSLAKKALFTHLETFNADLKACCINKIKFINRFLITEKQKYYEVIKLGRNTSYFMGMYIRDEISESTLRKMIDEHRRALEKFGNKN